MSLENHSTFLPFLSEDENETARMRSYRFKSFILNVSERTLVKDGANLALTPKVFDTLVFLVENAGHLVEKDAVMSAVWTDSIVEEGNVARTIHTIRRILGQDEDGNRFIETVPTKGYRFVAEVEVLHSVSESAVEEASVDVPLEQLPQLKQFTTAEPSVEKNDFPWVLAALAGVIIIFSGSWLWYGDERQVAAASSRSKNILTLDKGAYFNYQEGVLLLEKRAGDQDKALALFDKAIQLDPGFADAYARRAVVLMWRYTSSKVPNDMAQARTSVNKALDLDPLSSYAHLTNCRIKVTFDWDFKGAEKACRTAVALDPASHDAHFELAMMHSMYGRTDEAIAEIDRAIELAPTSFNLRSKGAILFYGRRFDEAIAHFSKFSEEDPEFHFTNAFQMRAYAMKGDTDGAMNALETRFRALKMNQEILVGLKAKYTSAGWSGVLREIVAEGEREPNKNAFGLAGPVHLAAIHSQLGEAEEAFETLEIGFKQRNVWMIHLLQDPRFDNIRTDPRFAELLQRIGLN